MARWCLVWTSANRSQLGAAKAPRIGWSSVPGTPPSERPAPAGPSCVGLRWPGSRASGRAPGGVGVHGRGRVGPSPRDPAREQDDLPHEARGSARANALGAPGLEGFHPTEHESEAQKHVVQLLRRTPPAHRRDAEVEPLVRPVEDGSRRPDSFLQSGEVACRVHPRGSDHRGADEHTTGARTEGGQSSAPRARSRTLRGPRLEHQKRTGCRTPSDAEPAPERARAPLPSRRSRRPPR